MAFWSEFTAAVETSVGGDVGGDYFGQYEDSASPEESVITVINAIRHCSLRRQEDANAVRDDNIAVMQLVTHNRSMVV